MVFAQIAKYLREEKGLSQYELAKLLGLSSSGICHLELGEREPGSPTLIAYAKFFNVSTDYLLGLEDDFGARVTAPIGDELAYSKEEKNLIEDFRALNYSCQKLVKDTIKTLRTSTEQSVNKQNKS